MLQTVLKAYGLDPALHKTEPFGSGLINYTWKVSGPEQQYILQRINKNVFKKPQDIAENLQLLKSYLKENAPNYLFTAPLPAVDGRYLVRIDGDYFRLSPFVSNSHTVDFLTESAQAYEAAQQFAKFTYLLNGFDARQLKYTLADFHNLGLRVRQFKKALANATQERMEQARQEIEQIEHNIGIADIYEQMVNNKELPLRVIHHDTKINNVLFNDDYKGLCVIDLDTVMPGYYISDVGDMMRTYLCEANEDEQDLDKIKIRESFFAAIYAGYIEQMGAVLTDREKKSFIYAGKFMIYMQAVRFLSDFLDGDTYYQTRYAGHNLMRAKNQLYLLEQYIALEPKFTEIISQFEQKAAGAAH